MPDKAMRVPQSSKASGADNRDVFINCPFDTDYLPFFRCIHFTVAFLGWKPRSALEITDSGQARSEKLFKLIGECRFGIHDLSRTEIDKKTKLPRFNMPYELGLFLGARRFGSGAQQAKVALVMDKERHRYKQFISDLSGHDVESHDGQITGIVREVRNFFSHHAPDSGKLAGAEYVEERYKKFLTAALPRLCAKLKINPGALTYRDFDNLVRT